MLLYFGNYYYGFDPTYILIIIGMVLSLLAQSKVKNTFSKYSRVGSKTGVTGAEAAEKILRSEGLYDVTIERVSGNLTDHYDPTAKVLRLSDSTYASTSVAAIGVAAHECGHAIQHSEEYAPLVIRNKFVPVANFGSKISWPLILIGLIFSGGSSSLLITAGIIAFAAAVAFHVITLPVEYDASNRALKVLESKGILENSEVKSAGKVLNAAALTYLAAAATAILQLLRLIILFGGRNRD